MEKLLSGPFFKKKFGFGFIYRFLSRFYSVIQLPVFQLSFVD